MAEENPAVNEPIRFAPISGDLENDEGPMEVESLCTNCEENGKTTLLFTKIPHFKEVVVMAFECEHCGWRNNELQPAGSVSEKGAEFTLDVPEGSMETLSRQVVKSNSAVLKIPELDFEIPPNTQKGTLSTVEGMLRRASENLQALQEVRRCVDPESALKIDAFCEKLNACADGNFHFHLILDDPAGNSFIESPGGELENDQLLKIEKYMRTVQQTKDLGLAVKEEEDEPEISQDNPHHGLNPRGTQVPNSTLAKIEGEEPTTAFLDRYSAPEEIMVLPGNCMACGESTDTRMFVTHIPYFKEVIVMSNACDACGYKNAEVRPGGGISEKGKKVTLKVCEAGDLRRDVIKSDTASVQIPELEIELASGTLGGLITTVEGVVARIREEMERLKSFQLGDSAPAASRQAFAKLCQNLRELESLEKSWTLIIRDPLSNSFISPLNEEIKKDSRLRVESFERTEEEEEHFGIAHLKEQERLENSGASTLGCTLEAIDEGAGENE